MNRLTTITDFNNITYDNVKLQYFYKYFSNYYNDKFNHNQGTEIILDVIKQHSIGGKWLDIGAGPATLFWALLMNDIKQVICSEISVEGLKVLHDFINSNKIPKCYEEILELYGISNNKLKQLRELDFKYVIFDAFKKFPSNLIKYSYDQITAFGVYGLCTNSKDYIECFKYPKEFLKENGVLIGANWIRSQKFISEGNTDNRYINTNLVKTAANIYGYEIISLSERDIIGDENYDKVVIWALRST